MDADDDEVLPVKTDKQSVELGSHGNTFLALEFTATFFLPSVERKLIRYIQDDLEFCTSPTGNRMLRIASNVKDSLFLLSNKE